MNLFDERDGDAGWLARMEDDRKRLLHCAVAVSDWLAGGCDIHDIPRPHIAALVEFAKAATTPDPRGST